MSETAVIIGASGGIGGACAKIFANSHDLALHYNDTPETVKEISNELSKQTRTAVYRADITRHAAVDKMMNQIRSDYGEITTLINAAGSYRRLRLFETDQSDYERTLSINFQGTVNCVKAVLREMRESEKNNQIVQVSSIAGTRGSPTDPIYAGAKGAVNAFTKSLARQYTEDRVFSNVVAPATTETKPIDEYKPDTLSEFPHGRMIQPDEVAEAVYFLGTTTSISGAVLEVDAGRQFTR